MRLEYCSVHARVLSGTAQAWHAYPAAQIQDLRALAARLRGVNACPVTIDVRARPCDHGAEAIRHICALVSGERSFEDTLHASVLCLALTTRAWCRGRAVCLPVAVGLDHQHGWQDAGGRSRGHHAWEMDGTTAGAQRRFPCREGLCIMDIRFTQVP